MTKLRGSLLAVCALALAAIAGCTSYITPHPVYAPLLDHAGQVDIAVRVGPTVPGAVAANANFAYAPVDHFEIVGGGDFNFGDDETRHYGGQLGIGTFVRDDTFRLELTAGAYGGYAEGIATGFISSTSSSGTYLLNGPYVMPYGQVLVGFESDRIELAGGLRVYGFFSEVAILPIGGASPRYTPSDGYERGYVEPVVTVRIPIDIVRVDLMTAFPFNPSRFGDNSPADLAPEMDLMWYFSVGVGFQFDTMEEEAPLPEPEYAPAPVYAPAPTYAPAPDPAAPPPPPPGYAPSPGTPIISPLPPPSSPPADAAPPAPPPPT